MGLPDLLICIPTKTGDEYQQRQASCEATWLRNAPCDYRFFSDADLGLDSEDEQARPKRTQRMAQIARHAGYDFMFRVDSDAYVWVNRLLASGYEKQDYVGYCIDYPRHLVFDRCRRTAHGGAGFTLSRKAMQVVIESDIWPYGDGIYWGDIWIGEALFKKGIECQRDTRFLEGHGKEDITPSLLPANHQYISVHPVSRQSQKAFFEAGPVSDGTVAPPVSIFEPPMEFSYGRKSSLCPCKHCQN